MIIINLLIFVVSLTSGGPAQIKIGSGNQFNGEYLIPLANSQALITIIDGENIQPGLNMFVDRNGSHFYLIENTGKIIRYEQRGHDPFTNEILNDRINLYSDGQFYTFNNLVDLTRTSFSEIPINMHHDFQFNAEANTMLVLQVHNETMPNQSGIPETMLVDNIIEVTSSAEILHAWNLADFANFTHYYTNLNRLNQSIHRFRNQLDPTHSNSIDWNTTSNTVWLNIRNFNQVHQINWSTGALEFTLGQGGDFSMYDKRGQQVEGLWYHGHDFHQISSNEFLIFDNGVNNITDPTFEKSSIVHIEVDYQKMEIQEVFRYTASQEYYSGFWGSVQLLPNGNYLGGFGARVHPFSDLGGIAIEVTPLGNEVWKIELPQSHGFYRFNRVPYYDSLKDVVIKSQISATTITTSDIVTTTVTTDTPAINYYFITGFVVALIGFVYPRKRTLSRYQPV